MVTMFAPKFELKKTLTLKSQIVQLFWDGNCSVKLPPGYSGVKLTLIYFFLAFSRFNDTHRENTPSNKLKQLQKVWICPFGKLVNYINYLYEVLTLSLNFSEK